MAKSKAEAPAKPKGQMVREAIEKLVAEKRDVTTSAILSLLHAAGLKHPVPMDIYQSSAWKELREREKAGAAPAPTTPAKQAATIATATSGVTKTEAAKQALEKLGGDAKPAAVVQFVKQQFGLDLSSQLVSNLKSALAKQPQGKRGPGRPAKTSGTLTAAAPRPAKASSGDLSLEDIQAVKVLVDRLGADKVEQLAQVLA